MIKKHLLHQTDKIVTFSDKEGKNHAAYWQSLRVFDDVVFTL